MEPFEEVCALLPPRLRRGAEALPPPARRRVEELRLRAGRVPTAVLGAGEIPLPGCGAVAVGELEQTVEVATQASAHAALERFRQGYFTVRGGHRLGLCGSVAAEGGRVVNLRRLSSLNIRVARAHPGCGGAVLAALGAGGEFPGVLLIAPPGGGKTTLLRDLVRLLSDGGERVGLCDERGEVAALWEGTPQFDVGARTDVLEGCPKAEALLMLLRGMDPQILACDEISSPADCAALEQCAGCGAKLLATVHAAGVEDLRRKPLHAGLLGRGLFAKAVVLGRDHAFRVEELPC